MSVRLAAVLVAAVLLVFLGCGSMSADTSCSQWSGAEQAEKDDYVRSDGYYSDADVRVEELDDLCKAVPGSTLGDLRNVHTFSELSEQNR